MDLVRLGVRKEFANCGARHASGRRRRRADGRFGAVWAVFGAKARSARATERSVYGEGLTGARGCGTGTEPVAGRSRVRRSGTSGQGQYERSGARRCR